MKKVEIQNFRVGGQLTNGEVITTKHYIGDDEFFVATKAGRGYCESEAATFAYLTHHKNKTHVFLVKHKYIKGAPAKKALGC